MVVSCHYCDSVSHLQLLDSVNLGFLLGGSDRVAIFEH